jgi:aminopeptidase N
MIFHMARRETGDEAFWNGLRNVVRTRMFRSASWTDFASELGAAAGKDMGPFFREWIGKAGAPSLSLSDVREERSGTAWRISGHVKQRPPYYTLRVPLRVETAGKPVDVLVSMDGEFASFTVTTTDRPAALRLDPDVDLFRRLDPREIPPTVNGIRGSDTDPCHMTF